LHYIIESRKTIEMLIKIKIFLANRWTIIDWIKSNKVKRVINYEEPDKIVIEKFNSSNSFLFGRLGGTEARFIGEYLKIKRSRFFSKFKYKHKQRWLKRRREIFTNAGFYFNSEKEIEKFIDLYHDAMLSVDILGAWGVAFSWVESEYLQVNPNVVPLLSTAPWIKSFNTKLESEPWSNSLVGKKVLIVSPFSDTISQQFENISKIFPDFNYPKFDLRVIRAPLTAGQIPSTGLTWFENLESLMLQMKEADFDVALISAGAYSLPLAHYAKKLNRIGIHAGGALQLFFGIMGNRWEDSEEIGKLRNNFWTRPSTSETPSNSKNIENGCYW